NRCGSKTLPPGPAPTLSGPPNRHPVGRRAGWLLRRAHSHQSDTETDCRARAPSPIAPQLSCGRPRAKPKRDELQMLGFPDCFLGASADVRGTGPQIPHLRLSSGGGTKEMRPVTRRKSPSAAPSDRLRAQGTKPAGDERPSTPHGRTSDPGARRSTPRYADPRVKSLTRRSRRTVAKVPKISGGKPNCPASGGGRRARIR